MAIVHIGIGSNMGNRQANCVKALEMLQSNGIIIKKVSSMHETEPWGLTEQPEFINMTIEAETDITPEYLLIMLKRIENEMGNKDTINRHVRWGPRIVDLDILFHNDIVISMEHLQIPHPLLHKRDFVLLPLSEIAPEKVHPILKKTVRQLFEELNG